MGTRWRCKRLFKFKKKPASPRTKQGHETSRTLKQQQTLFHRIMMKQAMLQEGLLQPDEYNRDKNDVLAVVTQDSEAEWPSLTRSKLLFLQDLLQAGLIADSEYHIAKRPILQRLADQGADVSYTDFVMDPVRNSLRNSIRKSRSVLRSYTRTLAASSDSQLREQDSDSSRANATEEGPPGGKTAMQHFRAAVGKFVPGLRGAKGKFAEAEEEFPSTPVASRHRKGNDPFDYLPYRSAPRRDAPLPPLPRCYQNQLASSPPRDHLPADITPHIDPSPPAPIPESPKEAVTPDINAVDSMQGGFPQSLPPLPAPPAATPAPNRAAAMGGPPTKGKDTIFRFMRKLSGLGADTVIASESPPLPFTISPSGLRSPKKGPLSPLPQASLGESKEGTEAKQRVWGVIRPAKRLVIEPIRRSQEKSRRTRDVTGVNRGALKGARTPGAASGNRRALRQPVQLDYVGEGSECEYEEEGLGDEGAKNAVEAGDSMQGMEGMGGMGGRNLTDLPLPKGMRGEAVPTLPSGRVLTESNHQVSNNTSDLKKKLSGWQMGDVSSGHGTAIVKSAEKFIKEGLNRLRADLMQAHPNAKVGITSEQVMAIAARKPADSADLHKQFSRQWVSAYGSQVLAVVEHGVKAHLTAMGHNPSRPLPTSPSRQKRGADPSLDLGSLSQATQSDFGNTLPESGGSNPLNSAGAAGGGPNHNQSTNYSVNQMQPTHGRQRWVESFPGEEKAPKYGGTMPAPRTRDEGRGGSKVSGATWAARGRQGRKANPIPSYEVLQENRDPIHAPSSAQPSRLRQAGSGADSGRLDPGETVGMQESMGVRDEQRQGGGWARAANPRAGGGMERKPVSATRGGIQRANPSAPVNLKERAAKRAAFVKHARTMPAGANTSTFFGSDRGGSEGVRHATVASRQPRGIPSMRMGGGDGDEDVGGGEERRGTLGRAGGQRRGEEKMGGVENEYVRVRGRRGGSEVETMGEGEEEMKSRPRRTHYRNPSGLVDRM